MPIVIRQDATDLKIDCLYTSIAIDPRGPLMDLLPLLSQHLPILGGLNIQKCYILRPFDHGRSRNREGRIIQSLGQCRARPIKFHLVYFLLFFVSVLQQITVLVP